MDDGELNALADALVQDREQQRRRDEAAALALRRERSQWHDAQAEQWAPVLALAVRVAAALTRAGRRPRWSRRYVELPQNWIDHARDMASAWHWIRWHNIPRRGVQAWDLGRLRLPSAASASGRWSGANLNVTWYLARDGRLLRQTEGDRVAVSAEVPSFANEDASLCRDYVVKALAQLLATEDVRLPGDM